MLKKNNRTKKSSSTRLYIVHRFKPKMRLKKKKEKFYSKIYTEFLFLSLFWVVKTKNCFTSLKLPIYIVKEFGPNPQNAPSGTPKKKA